MQGKDLSLTSEFDISYGPQQVDELLRPLYIDRAGQVTTTAEGNKPLRDLLLVSGNELKKQGVIERLKTQNPDWMVYPLIGATLEDFIGRKNTPTTAAELKARLFSTMTRGLFIDPRSLFVDVVPVSRTSVMIVLQIADIAEFQPLMFDYEIGLAGDF